MEKICELIPQYFQSCARWDAASVEDRDEGYAHESGWKTALADAIMGKERAKERGKGACMYYVQKGHKSKEQKSSDNSHGGEVKGNPNRKCCRGTSCMHAP